MIGHSQVGPDTTVDIYKIAYTYDPHLNRILTKQRKGVATKGICTLFVAAPIRNDFQDEIIKPFFSTVLEIL